MSGLPDPVEWAKSVAGIVKKHTAQHAASAAARVDDLERRLAALETTKHLSYRGSHVEGCTYHPNELTTCKGTIWFCRAETKAHPGESSAWQLMVKSESR